MANQPQVYKCLYKWGCCKISPSEKVVWFIVSTEIFTEKNLNSSHSNFQMSIFIHHFNCSVMSDCLQPHGLQHTRLPCSSLTPRACSNSSPSSQWCHPNISSSVIPFSSCLQSFLALGSFSMSQFSSGGQSIGASASALVLLMTIQDWSPLGWTGWISLLSKGLSRVFFNTTVQKHQFFGTQLSL